MGPGPGPCPGPGPGPSPGPGPKTVLPPPIKYKEEVVNYLFYMVHPH